MVKKLIFAYLLGGAVLSRAAEPDLYAYYTRLEFTQPPMPEMLGSIPVNAARMFAGGKPDVRDVDGRRSMVIWLELNSISAIGVAIGGV